MLKNHITFFFLILLITLPSCLKIPQPDVAVINDKKPAYMYKTDCPAAIAEDNFDAALADSIKQSINYYQKIPATSEFTFNTAVYSSKEMIKSHQIFLDIMQQYLTKEGLNKKIAANFDCYLMGDGTIDSTKFTGYFVPLIRGSKNYHSDYQVPIYGIPEDLKILKLDDFRSSLKNRTIVYRFDNNDIMPYYTREEINNGAIIDKAPIIAWANSLIDLFFLQVQGSGVIENQQGEKYQISYAGANGRDYNSIGVYLVKNNYLTLPEATLFGIKNFLIQNQSLINQVLNHNLSYVFFNIKEFDNIILGSINVPLNAQRSVASDAIIYPKGALTFVDTLIDDCDTQGNCSGKKVPFKKVMLNQDTGGAIKGNNRIDIYFGPGKQAEAISGNLNQQGNMYFLVAKKQTLNSP